MKNVGRSVIAFAEPGQVMEEAANESRHSRGEYAIESINQDFYNLFIRAQCCKAVAACSLTPCAGSKRGE